MNTDIKPGDYVRWEHDGHSGVGKVLAIETSGAKPAMWIVRIGGKHHRLEAYCCFVSQCTKIDPAVAKLFEDSNG